MKTDIILGGVGGQGILTVAMLVGRAAVARGLNVKQSEVHGMAQRGGAVVSHLRLSDQPIYSDLIARGGADVVLAAEPLEAVRLLEYLKPEGIVLTNSSAVTNIGNYPAMTDVLAEIRKRPRHVIIEAEAIAKDLGLPNAMNVVMLGALSPYLGLPPEVWRNAISTTFARKGEAVVAANLNAFDIGMKQAQGN